MHATSRAHNRLSIRFGAMLGSALLASLSACAVEEDPLEHPELEAAAAEEPAIEGPVLERVQASTSEAALEASAQAVPATPLACNQAVTSVACSPTRLSDDVFYRYDAASAPCSGRLLKCDTLDSGSAATTLLRVMYRTRTHVRRANGAEEEVDVPATGIIYVPSDGATGRGVVANTHGMTGMIRSPATAACAPSRQQQSRVDLKAMTLLADEVERKTLTRPVVVVPDFLGLGADTGFRVPDGFRLKWPDNPTNPYLRITHPYLSLTSEGRATIDLVRTAAEMASLTGVASRPAWMVAGYSQGGHAALATGEVWASGYDQGQTILRGVIAGAPGGDLDKDGNVDPDIKPILAASMLTGLSIEHQQLVPSYFLSDDALRAFNYTVNKDCLTSGNVIPWIAFWKTMLLGHQLYRLGRNPLTDPTALQVLGQNTPGRNPTGAPILIGQITDDPFIDPARTESTFVSARGKNSTPVIHCLYQGISGTREQRAQNHSNVLNEMTAATSNSLISCKDEVGDDTIPRVNAATFVSRWF